jgi:hypothetical protein
VPLDQIEAMLQALDPALSGTILAPAEAQEATNMPGFSWMSRARSEQVLAREGRDSAPERLDQVRLLNANLADRLEARSRLHAHLRRCTLLPTTRLSVSLAQANPVPVFDLTYDRIAPDGRWSRINARVLGQQGASRYGPLTVDGRTGVRVAPGLLHLLTRHFATPLMALREQIQVTCEVQMQRLSRTWIGPYWTPGCTLPPQAPAGVERGLVVHMTAETVAVDVRRSAHRDPWFPAPIGESAPGGQGIFRERRFAATDNVIELLKRWARDQGFEVPVVPLSPRRLA